MPYETYHISCHVNDRKPLGDTEQLHIEALDKIPFFTKFTSTAQKRTSTVSFIVLELAFHTFHHNTLNYF